MYTPAHFKETRTEQLNGLIRDYPFASVVIAVDDGLAANHLPFERVGDTLHGHVARGNELARADGAKVLVVFRGPDAYVSPSWYPSKHETGREVPTWNYAVVQVHGRLRVVDDRAWLRALLQRLTDHHEAHLPVPWRMDDAPADHVDTLLGAIVGLEITIERIEGKFKLSQNHPERNRIGVIQGLRAQHTTGAAQMAEIMSKFMETGHEK